VLGYLPSGEVRLGGDMKLRRDLAEKAVQSTADALNISLKQAASGIIDIVNENMYGALRLVSVEKGYDARDFALIAFGGAGPLHANALGKLMGSWPVIIPPGPGVLCAYGDATTRVRDEASRTFIRRFSETTGKEVSKIFRSLASDASKTLDSEGIPKADQSASYQVDIRYHGQGLLLTVDIEIEEFEQRGLEGIGERFDEMHRQLFTFALPLEKELVNLRAVAQGKPTNVRASRVDKGGESASAAATAKLTLYVEGKDQDATLYDRSKLKSGNIVKGPAIVLEMDSTTLILPGHIGTVDNWGNILITPVA
jgi:N-methylhydantoinase A